MSEQVYCLPAAALPAPQAGILPLSQALYQQLATTGEYRLRDQVETDERWRQIIPYAVVEYGGEVFVTQRLKAGSEARLHDRLSIGVGGHINPEEHPNARDVIEAALIRELHEELFIRAFFAEAVGLIHQTGGVSSVHTGVLYRVKTAAEVRVRETHKLSGAFCTWETLAEKYQQLEGWSQATFDFLHKKA